MKQSLYISAASLADAIGTDTRDAEDAAARLWRRDPALWSTVPTVQQQIANRLGWLSSPATMSGAVTRLRDFADGVKRDGFKHVVLLGMGGSSLAPEVLRRAVGVAPGWPEFHMLDSTDPAAIRAATTPPDQSLYILSSKSGGTIEPNCLAAYFRSRLESKASRWASHFVAITDEGTSLARQAQDEQFRDVFINPSDIGGRYSAISYFGLVPAALMGQDVAAIVDWSTAMLSAAEPGPISASANPAVGLGLLLGSAARSGRDKLTLVLPRELEAFGLWVEQLVAESTGKQGTGIVPIAGESITDASRYDSDRVFVRLRLPNADNGKDARLLDDLRASGAPIADIVGAEPATLGAEFVRWEIATAIAGAMLRINPFDEPNVQQAKDATRRLLDQYKSNGHLPVGRPFRTLPNGATLDVTKAAREQLTGDDPENVLGLIRRGDYFALLAYVGPDAELAAELRALRHSVRDRTRAATMFGYGPRYLHSTGQLHKGGPNTGVFLIVTADSPDLPIPGEPFSFATLELAQALGDFASLDATGRRAVHVHLPRQDPRLLREVSTLLLARATQASG